MKTSEIARIAGVSHTAVLDWVVAKRLKPLGERPLGVKRIPAYRFRTSDVLALLGISEEEAAARLAANPPRRNKQQ